MRITWHDNRSNGVPLARVLTEAGHQLLDADLQPDVTGDIALIDHDGDLEPYRTLCRNHDRVLVHPHGAGLIVPYWASHPKTLVHFVHGPGQGNVLQRIGYTGQIAVIGQSFCDLRPWEARAPRRILLALQHAMHDGYIEPRYPPFHHRIHGWLVDMIAQHGIELTVRWVGPWGPLGITDCHDKVRYMHGDGTIQDAVATIDQADCIIAPGWTFPTLALARGVSTIVYGQLPDRDSHEYQQQQWALFEDEVAYPFNPADCATAKGLWEMILLATSRQWEHVEDWRERFVGPPFDPQRFLSLFDQAVSYTPRMVDL